MAKKSAIDKNKKKIIKSKRHELKRKALKKLLWIKILLKKKDLWQF